MLPRHGEDLLDLAADYVHGTITGTDGSRLEAMLRVNPEARREFVHYCMLHGQIALSTTAVGPGDRAGGTHRRTSSALPGIGRVAAMVAGLSLAGCLLFILFSPGHTSRQTLIPGSYDNRQLPLVTVASLEVDGTSPTPINPTTLRPDKATTLRSASGADVNVAEATVFGVTAVDSGALYQGSVQARLAEPDANFSVTAAHLRIVDKGTAFRIDQIDEDHVAVTVLDGEVEVQSRIRLPACYWPFDDSNAVGNAAGFADAISGLAAINGAGAHPAAGLVGRGAVAFDNTSAAVVSIDGGTREQVGTGLFAMAEGITLEAMFVSAWSGRFGDYEEIFRKQDGDARVLLSLQNDGTTHEGYSEPPVPAGPCLSFGLHLAGRSYRELDMPLDGVERPAHARRNDRWQAPSRGRHLRQFHGTQGDLHRRPQTVRARVSRRHAHSLRRAGACGDRQHSRYRAVPRRDRRVCDLRLRAHAGGGRGASRPRARRRDVFRQRAAGVRRAEVAGGDAARRRTKPGVQPSHRPAALTPASRIA